MVSSEIALTILVLAGALLVDRLIGDPHSRYHPVALLGRFIDYWGKPEYFPVRTQPLLVLPFPFSSSRFGHRGTCFSFSVLFS
jgi:hypothetical protein